MSTEEARKALIEARVAGEGIYRSDEFDPAIGAAIREIRLELEATQSELAASIEGWNKNRVSKLEYNRDSPSTNPGKQAASPKDLRLIEQALKVPLGTILTRAGYVEQALTTEQAIRMDTRLRPRMKDLLLHQLAASIELYGSGDSDAN